MKGFLLILIAVCTSFKAISCTCLPEYEARGFCEVLKDAKNQPMFCIVQGKVISYYHWGMYVEVLENIYGTATRDTVLVWGDCGACCRPTFQGMASIGIGDTMILSLEQTDLCGNMIMPLQPDYESVDDYMLPGCGVYSMRYQAGNTVGWFYDNVGGPDTIDYAQFKAYLSNCLLTTDAGELIRNSFVSIYPNPTSASLNIQGNVNIGELKLFNGQGQVVYRRWPGRMNVDIDVASFPRGLYTLFAYNSKGEELSKQKVVLK